MDVKKRQLSVILLWSSARRELTPWLVLHPTFYFLVKAQTKRWPEPFL